MFEYRSDVVVDSYTDRLVAKCYTHICRINYQETSVPMTKMNTIKGILSLTINLDWSLQQLIMKYTFLYYDLDLVKEVYIDSYPGFI